jgi:hypothetical protein
MINRRSFLILAPAVAVVSASLLALPGCLLKNFAHDEAESTGGELDQIVDEYLKNFPQERDLRFLCESLSLGLENTTNMSFLSDPTVLVQIEQDFAGGRTLSLAGWILSRTELRVLALVSLLGR